MHSMTVWVGDNSRSRAPSSLRFIDFTPDCVVTRKNLGRIGTPISKNVRQNLLNTND